MIRADHHLHSRHCAVGAHLCLFDITAFVAAVNLLPASSVVPVDDFGRSLVETDDAEVGAGAEVARVGTMWGLVLVVEVHWVAELGTHSLDGAAGGFSWACWRVWREYDVFEELIWDGGFWCAASGAGLVVDYIRTIESVVWSPRELGLRRYVRTKKLTSLAIHVASRTDCSTATQISRGQRANLLRIQTTLARADPRCLGETLGLVHEGCSITADTNPCASLTRARARGAKLMAVFLALLTASTMIGRILAVFEGANKPFLFLSKVLTMRTCSFELRFLLAPLG